MHLLTFREIFKERIWGGRNLERLYRKPLPPNTLIGESWELADLPEDQSVVANGSLAGKTLTQLVAASRPELLGDAQLDAGQFPLLIKFLDARDHLSVQVHPDYQAAEKMGLPVRAKYECWYVVAAEEEAATYAGFKPGTTMTDVRKALADGSLADLLMKLPAKVGDFFYLPGGTVHALGAGIVVAEVQTLSDTTFRLFDWNRVDAKTGKPRELHVESGLACAQLRQTVEDFQPTFPAIDAHSVILACAPTFCVVKHSHSAGRSLTVEPGRAAAWIFIAGSGTIRDADAAIDLVPGKTIFLPAQRTTAIAEFSSHSTWLEVKLTR